MPKTLVSKAHTSADRDLISWIRVSDVVCSVAFALLCAMSVLLLSSEPSSIGCDFAGLLFLVIAASFRGSGTTWYTTLLPVGLLILFLPIAHWESGSELQALGGLLRASIVPGLSFLGGSIIVALRATRTVSVEGIDEIRHLSARGSTNLAKLRKMSYQMETVLKSLSTAMPAPTHEFVTASKPRTGWDYVEFQIDDGQFIPAVASETMSHADIVVILSSEMDAMSARHFQNQGLRLRFSAPQDFGFPLAVRGQAEVLREVVSDLLQRAIESLGRQRQQGLVRMSVRPNRQNVEISIEDNGRGLNEELIVKLETKGLMSMQQETLVRSGGAIDSSEPPKTLAEIRMLVEACGWKMHMQARLGVGARIVLELPRVDQDYSGVRIDRTREVLRAGTVVDPSASLDGWISASDQLN